MILFYFLSITIVSSGSITNKKTGCPSSISPYSADFDNKMYYVGIFVKLNWFSAVEYCSQIGMQLLVVDSTDEIDFLRELIKKLERDEEDFWTSGNNLADDDVYTWWSTGKTFDKTSNIWAKYYPSNSRLFNCLVLSEKEKYMVTDRYCYEYLLPICELKHIC